VGEDYREYTNKPLQGKAANYLIGEVRGYISERLPEYMWPTQYAVVEKIPLTANGKVDRKGLPEVGSERPETGEKYIAPRNEVEELVAGIWEEVLGVEEVGMEDNFFELGGHSLLATQVVSRIREIFKVDIALRRLFERPTIGGLSGEIVKEEVGSGETIEVRAS
jgi:acyl carrier protein